MGNVFAQVVIYVNRNARPAQPAAETDSLAHLLDEIERRGIKGKKPCPA
jgi:hypothetical protein